MSTAVDQQLSSTPTAVEGVRKPRKPRKPRDPAEKAAEKAAAKAAERQENLRQLHARYAQVRKEIAEERRRRMMARMTDYWQWVKDGKPPEISDDVLSMVLALHAEGEPLKAAAEQCGTQHAVVWRRCEASENWRAALARAREDYAHSVVSGLREIAESEPDPLRARLIADVLRFEVSKVLPTIYGEREQAGGSRGITFQFNLSNGQDLGQNAASTCTVDGISTAVPDQQSAAAPEQVGRVPDPGTLAALAAPTAVRDLPRPTPSGSGDLDMDPPPLGPRGQTPRGA